MSKCWIWYDTFFSQVVLLHLQRLTDKNNKNLILSICLNYPNQLFIQGISASVMLSLSLQHRGFLDRCSASLCFSSHGPIHLVSFCCSVPIYVRTFSDTRPRQEAGALFACLVYALIFSQAICSHAGGQRRHNEARTSWRWGRGEGEDEKRGWGKVRKHMRTRKWWGGKKEELRMRAAEEECMFIVLAKYGHIPSQAPVFALLF